MRVRGSKWVSLLGVSVLLAACGSPSAGQVVTATAPSGALFEDDYGLAPAETGTTPTSIEAAPTSSGVSSGGAGYQDDYGPVPELPMVTAAAPEGVSVALGETPLGIVLVNTEGFTLYALTDDSPAQSRCTGGCAGIWPPLLAEGAPTAATGIDPSKLSTLTRADGTLQVVYNGHPLYAYASDGAPGDVRGHGVGGVWFALDADGELIP